MAAVDQQDVGLPDPGHPALRADRGQRRQFEEAQRLPLHRSHATPGRQTADEAPRRDRPAHGVPPLRGGDAECGGVGDRLAQQAGQRIADARVRDATGREEKLQDASRLERDGLVRRADGAHRRTQGS
jgi:hypothetical protein